MWELMKDNLLKNYFEIGYGGKVVSFEPLSSAYEKLIENSKGNKRWEVAERCALGDENGEIQINIAMLNQLKEMGFALYHLSPGFQDSRIGRLLQVDGTFFRE